MQYPLILLADRSSTAQWESLIDLAKKIALYVCVRAVFFALQTLLFLLSFVVQKGELDSIPFRVDLVIAVAFLLLGATYALWKQEYSNWMQAIRWGLIP